MPAVRTVNSVTGNFFPKRVAPFTWRTGTGPIFSGIGDEAGPEIGPQIKAHQELGWNAIDLRLVKPLSGDKPLNLTLVDDETFAMVAEEIKRAGLNVPCFASAVANWQRPINGPLETDVKELETAIARMNVLGTPFIRVMSWKRVPELDDVATQKLVFERMRELVKMAEAAGKTLLHENCAGWAGESPKNSLALVKEMGSRYFTLCFDTGNPVEYGQNAWDYYNETVENTAYIHVKDGKKDGGVMTYTLPGQGNGSVPEVLMDLLARQYPGVITIEPHLAAVIHTGQEASAEDLHRTYIEYGRSLSSLWGGVLSDR